MDWLSSLLSQGGTDISNLFGMPSPSYANLTGLPNTSGLGNSSSGMLSSNINELSLAGNPSGGSFSAAPTSYGAPAASNTNYGGYSGGVSIPSGSGAPAAADPSQSAYLQYLQDQMTPYNASAYTVPSIGSASNPSSFLGQSYAALNPYYSALSTQNTNMTNTQIQQYQQDYQLGTQYLNQDVANGQLYATQDFQSAMSQLGITDAAEQRQLKDTLNQRGIAVTQTAPTGTNPQTSTNPTGNANPSMQYAGGGESQYELGQMNQGEALKQQATQRNYDRTNTQLGIYQQRTGTQLGLTEQRGISQATQSNQLYGENLNLQEQGQAEGMASNLQSQALQQQQMNLQAQQIAQQNKAQQAYIQSYKTQNNIS